MNIRDALASVFLLILQELRKGAPRAAQVGSLRKTLRASYVWVKFALFKHLLIFLMSKHFIS